MAGSYSDAVRAGTLAASRIHAQLGTKEALGQSAAGVDIFLSAYALGLTVIFRPLKTLLGAYVRDPIPGALVTTQRPLAIQRFTGAHELGHHILGHEPSLDQEGILRRMPTGAGRVFGSEYQEAEANAFAAAFMMPKWLILSQCERRGWRSGHLQNPMVTYQLSLRLGQSYEALTWTLERYNLINGSVGRQLRDTRPREIKAELLADYRPKDYRGDVWLLTEADRGAVVDGSRNDHFILRLREHSGAGYLWNADTLVKNGFSVLRDQTSSTDDSGVGGEVVRHLLAVPEQPAAGTLEVQQVRPWQLSAPVDTLQLEYDFTGPEEEGYSRAERRALLEAA